MGMANEAGWQKYMSLPDESVGGNDPKKGVRWMEAFESTQGE